MIFQTSMIMVHVNLPGCKVNKPRCLLLTLRFCWVITHPNCEQTYPLPAGTFEDDCLFPKVGYVNSLEGNGSDLSCIPFVCVYFFATLSINRVYKHRWDLGLIVMMFFKFGILPNCCSENKISEHHLWVFFLPPVGFIWWVTCRFDVSRHGSRSPEEPVALLGSAASLRKAKLRGESSPFCDMWRPINEQKKKPCHLYTSLGSPKTKLCPLVVGNPSYESS